MIEPLVQWVAPEPLWRGIAAQQNQIQRAQFRQPQLLRFATDSFMDEFMALLNNQPERLGEWRAQYETWRGPSPAPVPIEQLPPFVQRLNRLRLATATPLNGDAALSSTATPAGAVSEGPLKLYQPAHQRFYLVSSCLVCRIPGLPDRALDTGNGERVTYVVRRLRPKGTTAPKQFNLDTCDEYAFVNGVEWQKAPSDRPMDGEEQLPMFGVSYVERDGRKRRLFAGLVPVGKRETYMGAAATPVVADSAAGDTVDPRKAIVMRTVTDPWRSLITQANKATAGFDAPGPPGLERPTVPTSERDKVVAAANDQATLLSWYILLDLGDFLEKYVKNVWDAITDNPDAETLNDPETALFNTIDGATYTDPATGVTRSLANALVDIRAGREAFEATTLPYSTANGATPPSPPFPSFRFPLHSANLAPLVNPPPGGKTLDDLVNEALPPDKPADTPPLPLAAQISTLDMSEPGWFIIRCCFERPNCAPFQAAVLSEATQPFQLASFFDSDAPARPIRISLPLDTTAAGLRKFDKNTAFMISDVLCGQMQRMGGLTLGDLVLSVLPWPLHKDLPVADTGPCKTGSVSFGMVCSLSIPIITICALILLIIIVNLLDLIFRWIPFFITCFPIPKFSAKEGS
jgi:hypothetical protein